MKQRQAQAYLLYGMDLEEQFGDFPVERARESWLRDDPWQPARRYVERLRATPDWGERVVAANVCFEPLVGLAGAARAADALGALQRRHPHPGGQPRRAARMGVDPRLDGRADPVRARRRRARRRRTASVLDGWLAEWMPLAEEAALGARGRCSRTCRPGSPSTTRARTCRSTSTSCSRSASLAEPAEAAGGRGDERGDLRLRRHRDGQERGGRRGRVRGGPAGGSRDRRECRPSGTSARRTGS